MNIFYIDRNPTMAAMYHVDRHVVKMPLELAQMLSTAHHVLDGNSAPKGLYKPAYAKHPCTLWVQQSGSNYFWAYNHYAALLREYSYRYGAKEHGAGRLIAALWNCPRGIPQGPLTPFAQAMPDEYKGGDALIAYRRYYREGKKHLHKWTGRAVPPWIGSTNLKG